jgi:hypothetical protein
VDVNPDEFNLGEKIQLHYIDRTVQKRVSHNLGVHPVQREGVQKRGEIWTGVGPQRDSLVLRANYALSRRH